MKDKINILPRLNTQYELSKVMNEQDCGIFMNRAEGWNLELLEMMACGKWTVYTNYSGHTEFCEGLGGVDIIELEPAIDGVWFNGSSQWAHIGEEQIDEAVYFLRMIHQKVQSNDRFNQTGFDIAQEYTWKNAARKLLETL